MLDGEASDADWEGSGLSAFGLEGLNSAPKAQQHARSGSDCIIEWRQHLFTPSCKKWPSVLNYGGDRLQRQRLPKPATLLQRLEAANRFLKQRFVPTFNAWFAVPVAEPGSAFVPYAGRPLEDVHCIQEDRQVGRDNCVKWNGRSLQIPPQRHRHHYVKATVQVHE